MHLRAAALLTTLATGSLVLSAAAPAGAAACTIRQLTDTSSGVSLSPAISDDGTIVAFVSDADVVTGQNPEGNRELFRLDTTAGEPEQLTAVAALDARNPVMSGDGERIAFESDSEYGDLGDNGDGSREVWLYDHASGPTGIVQLTNTGVDSLRPSIDQDGTRIAFDSEGDLTGDNADGSSEIFLRDTAAATTTQLTDSSGSGDDSRTATINAAGTRVAFRSDDELTGDDDDGGEDLFLVDADTATITQLVDTGADGDAGVESMDASGNLVTFVSEADLTGTNADRSQEVFLHRVTAGVTTQLTSSPDDSLYSEFSDLDADGDRIVLGSNADLIGGNPDEDEYQLFVRDRAGRLGLDQLTSPPGDLSDPAINADGTRIAVEWSGDPLGTNPDANREIFLFTCGAPGPTYTDVRPANAFYEPIEWMAAAGVASGFPNGTFKPTAPVQRQQMANFVYNLAGRPEFAPDVQTFSDVPPSNPFYVPIEWMADNSIADGFPNGTFRPGASVKRAQMANFLFALAGSPNFTPGSATFVDVPASNPFFTQIEWMAAEGIASGFAGNRFKPNDPVRRQQMAAFLLNLLNGPGIETD
jgi:Tol biopolymer transport system component